MRINRGVTGGIAVPLIVTRMCVVTRGIAASVLIISIVVMEIRVRRLLQQAIMHILQSAALSMEILVRRLL